MNTTLFQKMAGILRTHRATAPDANRARAYADAPVVKPQMTLAQEIIATAERCRRPGGFDPPVTKDPTALAILAAGKKRRGETS